MDVEVGEEHEEAKLLEMGMLVERFEILNCSLRSESYMSGVITLAKRGYMEARITL